MTADWIVRKVRTSQYMRGVQIEIVNLNHPEGDPSRDATWTIPCESIGNPRYNWSGAEFLDAEAARRVLQARMEALGFRITGMGGNCRAYIRPRPDLGPEAYEELFTEDLWLPTEPSDPVLVGIFVDPEQEEPDNLRRATFAEALHALEIAAERGE